MSSATSTTTTTTTRADHAELFAAVPQQADDDEARADLRLLDDDYVDPFACAVAGHRWSALELAAYGSYRYCCVRARVTLNCRVNVFCVYEAARSWDCASSARA